MNFKTIVPTIISHFVWKVFCLQEEKSLVLPFFADGYPGLIFQEAENGLVKSSK
jgi:hypothetical protein